MQKLLVDGTLNAAAGSASDAAPSLFPLEPIPASAATTRPARPARRAAAAADAAPDMVEPETVALQVPSEAMRAALEEARAELLAARGLIDELVQSRRRG